jgi:hypothetical protein
MKRRLIAVPVDFLLPCGFTASLGRWVLLVNLAHWERGRGGWPTNWRTLPATAGVTAPIFRWWQLGPVQLRRLRWRNA